MKTFTLLPQAHLQPQAQIYRTLFEELVKKDLAIFEVRRQNDLLQCRVQAPSDSVKDEDFSTLLEHNLSELLDKRQLYLQVSLWVIITFFQAMQITTITRFLRPKPIRLLVILHFPFKRISISIPLRRECISQL